MLEQVEQQKIGAAGAECCQGVARLVGAVQHAGECDFGKFRGARLG